VDAQILRKEKGKKKKTVQTFSHVTEAAKGRENKKFSFGNTRVKSFVMYRNAGEGGGRDRGAAVKYKNSRLAITHDLEE